jgi:hypothetical protein
MAKVSNALLNLRKSELLDQVIGIINIYMLPDSGISPMECISEILRAFEIRPAARDIVREMQTPERIAVQEGQIAGLEALVESGEEENREHNLKPALLPDEDRIDLMVLALRKALGPVLKPNTTDDRLADAVTALLLENKSGGDQRVDNTRRATGLRQGIDTSSAALRLGEFGW